MEKKVVRLKNPKQYALFIIKYFFGSISTTLGSIYFFRRVLYEFNIEYSTKLLYENPFVFTVGAILLALDLYILKKEATILVRHN